MVQVSVCPATADRRSQWRALRPVLILGGFVAIWWALMTGVAQADSTPHHHLLDQVRSQVQAQHDHGTPVRDAVRRLHHDAQATTGKVHHQARNTTRPVTHTVSAVVDRTPLAPVTTKATTTIRTTLSHTVTSTRGLVAKSAAGPVVKAVEDTVKDAVEKPESSTGQGNSPSPRHSAKALPTSSTEYFSSASGQHSVTPDRAQASTDGPRHGPRGTPSLPDPCSSPSGSGSSSTFTPVGITESSLLVMPTVLSDHHTWRLARLPVGPAYQPGSSPD